MDNISDDNSENSEPCFTNEPMLKSLLLTVGSRPL